MFPNATDPLSDEERRELYRLSRLNVSIDKLVAKFRRTRSSIYRLISEMRAKNLIDQPIEFMDHDSFRMANADEIIFVRRRLAKRRTSTTYNQPDCRPIWRACINCRC